MTTIGISFHLVSAPITEKLKTSIQSSLHIAIAQHLPTRRVPIIIPTVLSAYGSITIHHGVQRP